MDLQSHCLVSVLLVEDEEVALRLLATVLGKKFPGIALHCAGNGKAGLELFQEHRQDLVITDINLPEMSGTQMADKIRRMNPGAKIIAISAGTGHGACEAAAGTKFGFDHYLFKPIKFEILFATIEACLREIVPRKGKLASEPPTV